MLFPLNGTSLSPLNINTDWLQNWWGSSYCRATSTRSKCKVCLSACAWNIHFPRPFDLLLKTDTSLRIGPKLPLSLLLGLTTFAPLGLPPTKQTHTRGVMVMSYLAAILCNYLRMVFMHANKSRHAMSIYLIDQLINLCLDSDALIQTV